jgi:hypothetical protein
VGKRTILVTDEPELAETTEAREFDEQILVPPLSATRAAESSGETEFGHVIGRAIERLNDGPSPFALWLHARGLSGAWDAPTVLREHLRDDEDPPAATWVAPPSLRLPTDFDPDELLPICQAYAAQVLAIDECLEALCDALDEQRLSERTLLVVTAPRGYLLGQQGYAWGGYDALLEDLIHVPLLVRFPDARRACERGLGLCESRDLYELLAAPTAWTPPARDRILITAAHETALRTAAWHARWIEPSSDDARCELYAKPDDRYEANDVASRASAILDALSATRVATSSLITAGAETQFSPLEDDLTNTNR